MKWTFEKTWKTHSIKDSSFIYPSSQFKGNPLQGLEYVKKELVPYLGGGKVKANSECIYQYSDNLAQIEGSKILVIGGGPSSMESQYSVSDYDHVFSCNHFYNNETINKIKMFMVFLGDEIDFESKNLKDYLKRNDETLICFENVGRPKSDLVKFKTEYGERVVWGHTRYHSKIGAMTRIISYLCNLKPKHISIVGMDGPILPGKEKKHFHSFQPKKWPETGTFESLYDQQKRMKRYVEQYLEFWDYILHDVGSEISFNNVGHKHACNLSTEILTDKLGEEYQEYLNNPDKRVANG
tara:strand:+ start:8520 stop:9407 length:888 start_codon:yes stop_codon:yes gene_type:complete